jgi:hypothetical protein
MDPAVDWKVAARLAARRLAGKRASRHDLGMRRLALLAAIALLAACARAPRPGPGPITTPVERPSGALVGLTASELGQRFGKPGFQVREGAGTKLQRTGQGCVLDVYLYPPENGRGAETVTFADARRASGADISVEACLAYFAP